MRCSASFGAMVIAAIIAGTQFAGTIVSLKANADIEASDVGCFMPSANRTAFHPKATVVSSSLAFFFNTVLGQAYSTTVLLLTTGFWIKDAVSRRHGGNLCARIANACSHPLSLLGGLINSLLKCLLVVPLISISLITWFNGVDAMRLVLNSGAGVGIGFGLGALRFLISMAYRLNKTIKGFKGLINEFANGSIGSGLLNIVLLIAMFILSQAYRAYYSKTMLFGALPGLDMVLSWFKLDINLCDYLPMISAVTDYLAGFTFASSALLPVKDFYKKLFGGSAFVDYKNELGLWLLPVLIVTLVDLGFSPGYYGYLILKKYDLKLFYLFDASLQNDLACVPITALYIVIYAGFYCESTVNTAVKINRLVAGSRLLSFISGGKRIATFDDACDEPILQRAGLQNAKDDSLPGEREDSPLLEGADDAPRRCSCFGV